MCTQNTLDWGQKNLTLNEIQGQRVLEIGSYNVNGSLRSIIEPLRRLVGNCLKYICRHNTYPSVSIANALEW